MSRIRFIVILILTAVAITLSGCAKFPTGAVTTGKQLVITLKVRGQIAPIDELNPGLNRHYFIAIDNDGEGISDSDPNTGPWAVAFPPYGGNGWVTSQRAQESLGVTDFLQYDAANPGGYLYRFVPGTFLLSYTNPQPPIRYELIDAGTVRFTIDLGQLDRNPDDNIEIEQLDINIITTNELAVNPNQLYPGRQFDGMGPTGQDYVTVDTTNDGSYSGTDDDMVGVSDLDLDIDYWSIQVQTVSSR